MKEKWKIIEEYSDYQISNFGRVKSFRSTSDGLILKPQRGSQAKYLQVRLFNGIKKIGNLHYIHRLVAHHFIRPITTDDHIHHIDENIENNYVGNIEIVTQTDHMKRHCMFSDNEVKQIREDIINAESGDQPKIAEKWNTSTTSISFIKSNDRYPNIGRWKEAKNALYSSLTPDDIKTIREEYKTDTIRNIADRWDKAYHVIWRIVTHRSYKNIK